jgi:hypothetical protein
MTMLFPAIIDGHSIAEATRKSIKLGIQYFDRVFGAWLSYILLILALVSPLFIMAIPLIWESPMLAMVPLGIYGVIMVLFLAFVVLPALSIGLTRVYMILTADDEDIILEESDDESGPSFIGGL